MSEYDSDIEFDFFDDLETGESPPSGRSQRPARPPGPPKRPPDEGGGRGIPPTARLLGLIVFGILIVVLLVLWVQSCSGTSKKGSFESYLNKVSTLASDGRRFGSSFSASLQSPGIKAADLAGKLVSLAQQQQSDVEIAKRIKPPSSLTSEQAAVVQALTFRAQGLSGLADALRTGAGSTNVAQTASTLASETQRLVAADVIWEDGFRQATLRVIAQQQVSGLTVPRSQFLQDSGVDSATFWTPVIERLNGNTTGGTSGKAVGTALVSVVAQPCNTQLSTQNVTTVNAGTNLEFDVTVQNSGDVQVVSVPVTITIKQTQPITQTKTISLLNPGETKVVKFKHLPSVNFATQTKLNVDVKPVPGETNPGNNSAQYNVLFSLTGCK
jgi:CARDB